MIFLRRRGLWHWPMRESITNGGRWVELVYKWCGAMGLQMYEATIFCNRYDLDVILCVAGW